MTSPSMNPGKAQTLAIEFLGHLGEGVARGPDGPLFIPYALAGETVTAHVDGNRGTLAEILQPSAARIPSICSHFTVCGGCAVQTLRNEDYAQWKRAIVVTALAHGGVEAQVQTLQDARGEGRRRATFHARAQSGARRGPVEVGFMRARSHDIIAIDECPVLAPSMASALPAARALAKALAHLGKPLDAVVTATNSGLDVDLRGIGKIDDPARQKLVAIAGRFDLARLANHGEIIVARRDPVFRIGDADVILPPGSFVQATQAAEDLLSAIALKAFGKSSDIADLFCGIGTFALRFAERARVHCVESDAAAVLALTRASRSLKSKHAVSAEQRDLFRQPLTGAELDRFDAVIFDPPRAGAQAQAAALAASKIPVIAAVSCNAASFARDARILMQGGYAIEHVTPIDQFVFSPHVEIIAVFRKAAPRRVRRAGLLS